MSKSAKKVKPLWKRIMKWTLLSLLTLVLLLSVGVGLVLHVVFTPEKLAGLVEQVADEHLNAEVHFDKIDLTFFSTFPDLGVEMENVSVLSKVHHHDSASIVATDSLLDMKYALLTINPRAYLVKKRVIVKDFVLEEPRIYAFVDTAGIANWDVMYADMTESLAPADTVVSDSSELASGILLKDVRIRNGQVIFDDRNTQLYARVDGLNLGIDGWLGKRRSRLNLRLGTENILFWQEGQLLVNKLAFGMETAVKVNRDSLLYTLEKAAFNVNGVRFGAEGTFRGDTLQRTLAVNVKYGIHIPSLKTLLDLVPEAVLKQTDDVDVRGEVFCHGELTGLYGKKNIPLLTTEFRIKDGYIAYPGMPSHIDTLNVDFKAFVDLQKEEKSYINLRDFRMRGGGTVIGLKGNVEDLLTDPVVKAKLDAEINFEDFTRIFPLAEGITCKGDLKAALLGNVLVRDVMEGNYGKIRVGGGLQAKNVHVFIPQDSIVARIRSAGLAFASNRENKHTLQGKDLLNGFVGYSGLNIHVKNRLRLLMDTTYLTLKTSPLRDTTAVASVSSRLKLGRTLFIVRDTLLLGLKQATANASLRPRAKNPKAPRIHARVQIDSLRSRVMANRLNIAHADVTLNAVQNARNKKRWVPSGDIEFSGLRAFTPFFPVRISMPGTHLRFNRNEVSLDSALIRLGRSDLYLTGNITNLARSFFRHDTLRGELRVASRYLNCNQLLRAMKRGTEYMERVEAGFRDTISGTGEMDDMEQMKVVEDTTAIEGGNSIFIVPPRVDFTFQTYIGRLVFGKMRLDKIHGEMVMRNQCLQLTDLGLRSVAADMKTSALYRAIDTTKAYAGFSLQMSDIRIDSLVYLMPALDTLFPMLRSFSGTVNFNIAADGQLDTALMIDLPTLRGAAYLDGRDLVLMDGETFAEISKMLMFKNKERNMIDSISVDLSVKDGTINIYPFLVEIDRYKAAVGGQNNVDMSFNYHISILKSPLPFKAGLDISGNLDNLDKMKFKITKAKYKDIFMPSRRTKVDSTQLNLKARFREMLDGIVR